MSLHRLLHHNVHPFAGPSSTTPEMFKPHHSGTPMIHPLASLIAAFVMLIATGCSEPSASPPKTAVSATAIQFTSTETATAKSALNLEGIITAGFTHIRSDGNRYVTGKGDIPNITPEVIPSRSSLEWVIGLPIQDDMSWVIIKSDESVIGFVSRPDDTFQPLRIRR